MVGRLRWLPQARWKRWLIFTAITCLLFVMFVTTLIVTVVLLWRNPGVQAWVMVRMIRNQVRQAAPVPPPPQLSAEEISLLRTNAATLSTAADLFQFSNVWDVRLEFTSNQWASLGPNIVPPVMPIIRTDGTVILRNPAASRNGLAGVLGLDFPWSKAKLEFADLGFSEVGARFKGNGTFNDSQRSYKRPFKVELKKYLKSQRLAGRTTLNFHNLVADGSYLSDTMAYEFFRQANVPAARTAFARLRLTVGGRFEDRLLGLYLIVENPDAEWAREYFGHDGIALFKPVTYELFKDLGEDWKAYEDIYDPKTKPSAQSIRRLIALAKLVSHAPDVEFAQRIGEFIDLDEFARFLACQVILSNYDGLLSDGQNFLVYYDPQTERFGFIPWDLDHCWGEFPFLGTIQQREQASLQHPWVGENHFLERMLAAGPVAQRYRHELERIRATQFQPEQLSRRLDELVQIVRPFVAEESSSRLARFRREVADEPDALSISTNSPSRRHGFALKHFFTARAKSVTDQLEGRSQGVIISHRPNR